MDQGLYTTFVIYYIVLITSLVCNTAALVYLLSYIRRKRGLKLFTTVLFYLHLTLVSEELTTIPFLYKYNVTLCIAVESLKFYFGLKNILSILFIVRFYSLYIQHSTDFYLSKKFIPYLQLFLTGFPMITFLPYVDGTYDYPDDPWCSLPTTRSLVWEVFIQYLWVWLMLFVTIGTNIRIIWNLYSHYDSLLMHHYVTNVVSYSVLAFISWVPRTVLRFAYYNAEGSTDITFYSYFPAYIAGILFALLFFKNISLVIKFEEAMDQNRNAALSTNSIDWNQIVLDRNSQLTSQARSVSKQSLDMREFRSTFGSPLFGMIDYGANNYVVRASEAVLPEKRTLDTN